MKHPVRLVLAALFAVALPNAIFAEASADTSPEQEAVLANDRAYEAAYAKGDAKAIADFFAADADYTTEDGRTFSGSEAIGEAMSRALVASRGSKLLISADTVRDLAPGTVLEKGSTTVTTKSGETMISLFTAIHIKKDGVWKISQLIESPLPDISSRQHLEELAWLVGEWEETDKTNDLRVNSQYVWARGGNFLTRNMIVKRGGVVTLEGWEIIGWDPVGQCLRSWTFDGDGGFAEGLWTNSGERWLVREIGYAPDGSRITADNTITKVSGDRIAWESTNRTLNGEPQPGIGRIEINRVKGN